MTNAMDKIFKYGYKEDKPHRLKRLIWMVVNATVFPVIPHFCRRGLLRLFGAKIAPTKTPIYGSVRIFAPWNLEVGEWCCIGPRVRIYNKGKVTLGERVILSQEAYLCTASHEVNDSDMKLVVKPIAISGSTWIAAKAVVLPGVTVGEGAVVGCAAIVTHDVEPWTVVVGNPAKFIKKREIEDEVQK